MKTASKITLALYLLFLLWVIVFKFSLDLSEALANNHSGSLNLVPFANYGEGNIKELIYNFLVFVPLGLLLSVNFKKASFLKKLTVIFIFSLTAETVQYITSIGASDITDVISNTSGGLLGLAIYKMGNKHVRDEKIDRHIIIAGTVLLIMFVSFFGILSANGVRFQSGSPPDSSRMRRQDVSP